MYISVSQKRIGSAVLVGAAIIAASVYLRSTNDREYAARTASNGDIVVTEAPKRVAIAVTDSNGDGVPDWQESLVSTETLALNETPATSYTAPDTLTGQFSQQFIENYVRNKTMGDYRLPDEQLVQNATAALAEDARDTLLTMNDVVTQSNNSPAALSAYGEAVALIIQNQNDTTGENEAAILNRAIANNDSAELAKLDVKIAIYQKVIAETKALPVPTIASKQHLDLLNTYRAILADIVAMRYAFDDPMLALLRIKRYDDDTKGLVRALENLYTTLYENGASWNADSAVGSIINLE